MSNPSARPVSTSHRVATVISVAFSIFTIIFSLPIMQGGAADSDQVPYPVIIVGFALSVVTIVAGYGVWTGQRWGVVLTIVMNALAFLIGAPGVLFGPTAFLVVSSVVACVANIVVVVLLLLRPKASSSSTVSRGVAV